MPRKPANRKNDTIKNTTRRKETTEPVVETAAETTVVSAPVEDTPVKKARKPRAKKTEVSTSDASKKRVRKSKSETVADAVTETPVTGAEEAPVKKRGRKPKEETVAAPVAETTVAAAEEVPAKKRGRKPKAASTTDTDAPVKKRGRKKAAPEIVAEAAPAIEAQAAFADSEPVEIKPDVVVNVADEPLPGQISFDGEVTAESTPVEEVPAPFVTPTKKRRGRPPKKDAKPKRRGRPPKSTKPALVLTTTLQVGETEFDISALAEKAYKEYKRVHKRKIVTDFHLYVKPEEGAAYFTVNGEGAEDFKVDLTK